MKFEPLPSAAMAHARAALLSAAAGSAAADASDAEASGPGPGESALLTVLTAEPINERTRLWAAFEGRAAADAGVEALTSLPQLAELVDPPPVGRDTIMPACEAVPPPLSDSEANSHAAR